MTFANRVFFWAGIWGLLVIVPGFFNEPWIAAHMPPAITHPEFFYGFYTTALAFQILFLLVARDPVRFRPIMPVCMLEKFAYIGACLILIALGRLPALIIVFAVIDGIWGLLFVAAYMKTKEASAVR